MDKVEHAHWLPYDAKTIYEFLTDPDQLASVVGRISKAKVMERIDDNHGKLAVVLDLPARKTVDTVGDVAGVPYEQLSFQTHEPFPLHFAWQFIPADKNGVSGTNVIGTLGFDLSAFGLPMAGMMVRGIVTSELKNDLKRLEEYLTKHTSA